MPSPLADLKTLKTHHKEMTQMHGELIRILDSAELDSLPVSFI